MLTLWCSCHTKEKCFKIHGYPPGFKKTKATTTQPSVLHVTTGSGSSNETQVDHHQYQQLITYMQAQMEKASTGASESKDS